MIPTPKYLLIIRYVFGTLLAQGHLISKKHSQNLNHLSLMLKPGFLGSVLICFWKVDAHPLLKIQFKLFLIFKSEK